MKKMGQCNEYRLYEENGLHMAVAERKDKLIVDTKDFIKDCLSCRQCDKGPDIVRFLDNNQKQK